MAAFDGWAEYYDLIHDGLPGDAEFCVMAAVRQGGPALELGVGTGRIAIPMAMSGVDVTGLDNSRVMLAHCRAKKRAVGKTRGQLSLICGDMTDFSISRQFPFVLMAYRTFMHLLTVDEQRLCLDAVHRHLSDDGVFVLNTWAPKPATLAIMRSGPFAGKYRCVGRYPLPEEDGMVVHYYRASCNETESLLTEEHVIHEEDRHGRIVRETSLPLVRTWIQADAMERLVVSRGFAVESLYGDFEGGAFTEESTEMIWVLRRDRR